jgi:hypothetical protein
MENKTAVEWLFSQLPDHLRLSRDGFDMLKQANAMFQQQIEDAYNTAIERPIADYDYYSQTFKSKENDN